MKYPKAYSKKAMDVLGENYFIAEEGAENTALLTLAAHCINLVAHSHRKDSITFDMLKMMLTKPIKHRSV
jgi:hypothetical protein